MPRLSNYRPFKSKDYKFIDRQVSEMFQFGATDVFIHKYLGPKNPEPGEATADQPQYDAVAETNIQDLLFLENRDRKYESSIYCIRGSYNVQDLDFNLSQFGLFLDNDTVFMTVHINDFIRAVGRKPMTGDVTELPHLLDEFAANSSDYSLPRFYVISDVGRAAEGFSKTWYPHLYRLKLTKISDEAQYSDILIKPADPDANFVGDYSPDVTYYPGEIVRFQGKLYTVTDEVTGIAPPDAAFYEVYAGETLKDLLSTNAQNLQINDALLAQAESDVLRSGYDTEHFFTLAIDPAGNTTIQPSAQVIDDTGTNNVPVRSGYTGYLLGDGIPTNGAAFGNGIAFPLNAVAGDYFLRVDFLPNRLFYYDGTQWTKREDSVRHTLTPTNRVGSNSRGPYDITTAYAPNDVVSYGEMMYIAVAASTGEIPVTSSSWIEVRQTHRAGFINNEKTSTVNGVTVAERQALSKALRPRADF
jgi:hypothetical protein